MKILRNCDEVGIVDLASAELHSIDPELTRFWNKWLKDGFKVLIPPLVEPPPGIFADAVYTICPGPDNLGLVAIELGNNGYELGFRVANTSAKWRDEIWISPGKS